MAEIYANCVDCPFHKVIHDPDPFDWFRDNDMAIVCEKMPNRERRPTSPYASDQSAHRVVASGIDFNLRAEGKSPKWCPLKGKMGEKKIRKK
jgi:hypothetical protein